MYQRKYRPSQWCLTLEQWPAADRAAFEAATTGRSYRKAGPGAHWAPATKKLRADIYGNFLQFLKLNGELDDGIDPASRVTFDRLTRYIASVKQHRSPASTTQSILDLERALSAMFPDKDWAWVRAHPDRPFPHEIRRGTKPKRLFDPMILLARALDGLDGLIDERPTYANSIAFRDLAIVAFMCAIPLRASNVCDMALGDTVHVYDDAIVLDFDGKLVKNDEALSGKIPGFLLPYLRHYTQDCRPLLLNGNHSNALWVNWRHKGLDVAGLDRLLVRTGQKLLGRLISAHDFRYSVVTRIAEADPRKLDLAPGVLGHKTWQTSTSVYNRASSSSAFREWRDLLHNAAREKNPGRRRSRRSPFDRDGASRET